MHIFRTEGIGDGGFIPRKSLIQYPCSRPDPWQGEVEAAKSHVSLSCRLLQPEAELLIKVLEQLSKEPIGKLKKMLCRGDVETRKSVVYSLMLKRTTEAVLLLIDILTNDEDEGVRFDSANALGSLGAKEAVSALLARLNNDENGGVRFASVNALGILRAKEAIPALTVRLKDEDVRDAAKEAIEQIREKNKE